MKREKQKQVAIGALGAGFRDTERLAPRPELLSQNEPSEPLSRQFWTEDRRQGTRSESRHGRKESNCSLFPRWREESRARFQIKQTGRRGPRDGAEPLDACRAPRRLHDSA